MLFKTITYKIFIFFSTKNTSTKENKFFRSIKIFLILFRSKFGFISNTGCRSFSIKSSWCSRFACRSFCIKLNKRRKFKFFFFSKSIFTDFCCSRVACCCLRLSRFPPSDIETGFLPVSDGSLTDA